MPFTDIQLNDGNKIPAIAFGSGSVNKGKDIHQYVEQAIETGFSHLDTAQYYQNEEYVGVAIRESGLSRSELYVTSKYGLGSVQDAFHASLTKLGLTHLDLYLIHTPMSIEPGGGYEAVWSQFEKFKENGLTKSIGVSNFTVEHLQQLLKVAKVKPAVNQIRLHPYNLTDHASLLEYHAKHGIITEAYGSLAPITTYPGGPVDGALEKAADRLGITPTQVVFLWVKAKGAVIVTTSSNKQHLEEYLAVGDLPDLTEDEVAAIDAAGAKGPPASYTSVKLGGKVPTWWRILAVIFLLSIWLFIVSKRPTCSMQVPRFHFKDFVHCQDTTPHVQCVDGINGVQECTYTCGDMQIVETRH